MMKPRKAKKKQGKPWKTKKNPEKPKKNQEKFRKNQENPRTNKTKKEDSPIFAQYMVRVCPRTFIILHSSYTDYLPIPRASYIAWNIPN